ncbi:transcriptional regulator, TetR family [Magnetococcus marinus MC-1]|uniref:Transcriptional regulator, TetR family n=1 Tax=Magnetococcus marinus (strain ATCC BAA-1437 / JCM 17883 / MC-1) TaxID=156889 RepID=A0L9T6_MAGMM|nr:TetR/AcrR family transcriptional regulator [Magnetococcus marinus]ABK44729.1 transcriptional regulator, TetR family [Magnetococcus marinus MC-1]
MEPKHKRIIEAAIALFAQRGLDNISTAQIARAADVSLPILLQEFDSKEPLLQEILHQLKRETIRVAHNDLRIDMGLREHLSLVWHNLIEWALEHPERYQLLLTLCTSNQAQTLLGLSHDDFSHLFPKEPMLDAIEHGTIATLPSLYHQHLFRLLLDGTVQYILRTKPDDKQCRLYIDQTFALYWRAIHNR